MDILGVINPFKAPVYHTGHSSSTMVISRRLAGEGEPHGTVVLADYQDAGRGRVPLRSWKAEPGMNLLCTILLRFPDIHSLPGAMTLRTGLAVARAIEDFAPPLAGRVAVKWPNDIMIGRGKAAGILTEGDGKTIHVGIGVNVAQRSFPAELVGKAVSIASALDELAMEGVSPEGGKREWASLETRTALLEGILFQLHAELSGAVPSVWQGELNRRLYKRGECISFVNGAAGSGAVVEGILKGIGENGELLILPDSGEGEQRFITGELHVY